MEQVYTNEKILGTRCIKNRIKAVNQYKTIIFILIIISLLSIVNCFLIYQYALEVQTFANKNILTSNEELLAGEIINDINNISLKDNEFVSLSSSYLKTLQKTLNQLVTDNERLSLEIIELQEN